MYLAFCFAADTGKAIQLGTDALSKNVNTASAPTVYFGQDHENNPAAWRVIGYNGNGVASAQGDMTLLAAGNMSSVLQFADFGTNNRYASSYLKTAIDALAEKLTTEENTAVKKRTLTSGSYNGENTDCVAGEQVDNAVFWPLSTAEAFAVNQDLRIVDPEHPSWASSYWWLRSPGYSDHDAATVNGDGSVVYSGNAISSWWCVRPAFNLNSSSVLFTSAAVGGKPDGGLTPISKYTGNEWKLTLKDSNRNFAVTETTVSGDPGDTVTLHYTGATAGINEYISVILADNSGAQYYGRVAQPTAENGTVEIKIPSGLAPGSYTLKVFSEQCNDDKKTDYASDFVDIDLTVGYQEQFTLTPGGVYYFDLSGVSIPGTANGSLPDKTMHYVPFTYAGTVDAYKLTSEMATTEEYAQQNEYAHSLFVADYAVTHAVSWDDLNATGLIFGKGYATGSVDYTLRAPSGGSGGTGSGALERGTPQSNEWDRILDKDDGYIKNWRDIGSWGQDTLPNTLSNRVIRGRYDLPRKYAGANTTLSFPFLGFRPVLEVLNSDTLGSDGLKAVTLDLGGGKFGGSSDTIQIIVKTGESFTAPASDGLTRPDGNTGSYFEWLGSDGELYAPDDNVPADVTKLTAQFVPPEQFNLAPGGVYYFDLSGVGIPDTVNDALPDNTLHYVPFTYAGTVDAYKLTSEMATTEEYAETCDGCDKWFEDATGASEITDKTSVILAATGHSVSDWKSDHTDHWKECTVVGCGVIIEDSKAAHTAGEWIIDTPATATTSGSKHKECTVCGYMMATETIPATGGGEHTHSYGSDWKYDADTHWHECSCGDKADKAAHDFKWVVDKEATATQKGSKHEECKVCGYKKAAVEIPATGSTTKPTDPTQTNPNTGAESPKTGDNSNMILWIALLFISSGAVIGITVYSKKKKENAE